MSPLTKKRSDDEVTGKRPPSLFSWASLYTGFKLIWPLTWDQETAKGHRRGQCGLRTRALGCVIQPQWILVPATEEALFPFLLNAGEPYPPRQTPQQRNTLWGSGMPCAFTHCGAGG